MFAVSEAKREILRKLTERDWSPTDLAEELEKSPAAIYNHLNDLAERGVLTSHQVSAKTRPKTNYSIGRGLIQYLTVLPGQFQEGALNVTSSKEAMFRIWAIPQDAFHPFLERYWWSLVLDEAIDPEKDLVAAGVFGSVARGNADEGSDIDILLVVADEDAKATLEEELGSVLLRSGDQRRIGMTEIYTAQEFEESLTRGSDFLATVLDEIHPLFDPERRFMRMVPDE